MMGFAITDKTNKTKYNHHLKNNVMKLLICLYADANSTCKTIANLAAEINGGVKNISLQDLAGIFKSEKILNPYTNGSYELGENDGETFEIYCSTTTGANPALKIQKLSE
jgi:hypothetical protein